MRALNGVTANSCRGARLHGGSADLIGCGVTGFQLPTPSVADSGGPMCTTYMPNTANARARSTPTRRPIERTIRQASVTPPPTGGVSS